MHVFQPMYSTYHHCCSHSSDLLCYHCIIISIRWREGKGSIEDAPHAEVDFRYGGEHCEGIGDTALLAELTLNLVSRIKVVEWIVIDCGISIQSVEL